MTLHGGMTSRDMFVVAEEMEKLLRERSKLHDDLMQSNQQLQESRQQVPFGFRLSARERVDTLPWRHGRRTPRFQITARSTEARTSGTGAVELCGTCLASLLVELKDRFSDMQPELFGSSGLGG